jgi:hypothetical protein
MKYKYIIVTIITVAILAVAYWLLSPLWRKTYVNESLPVSVNSQVEQGAPIETGSETVTQSATVTTPNQVKSPAITTLKTGTFTGFDRLHNGSGTASLIQVDGKYFIRFESDFTVTNGPDLFVGFGNNGVYAKGSEIAKLKGTDGAQNYELPADFDPNNYGEVWVWCKAFAVPFAKAELK